MGFGLNAIQIDLFLYKGLTLHQLWPRSLREHIPAMQETQKKRTYSTKHQLPETKNIFLAVLSLQFRTGKTQPAAWKTITCQVLMILFLCVSSSSRQKIMLICLDYNKIFETEHSSQALDLGLRTQAWQYEKIRRHDKN